MRKYYFFVGGLFVVSALLIVMQVTLSSGPKKDLEKVEDISKINSAVDKYATDKKKLPDSLSDLSLSGKTKENIAKNYYEYKKVSTSKFEICATFDTDARSSYEKKNTDLYDSSSYGYAGGHGKGRECFDDEVYSLKYYDDYEPTTSAGYSVCDTTAPKTYKYDAKIISVDSKGKKLSVSKSSVNYDYALKSDVKVFALDCTDLTVDDLKKDDIIDIFYSGSTVSVIQRRK
jgi:hypothetical protein